MISDVLARVHHQTLMESDVKADLLILLMTKTVEFRTEMPDWSSCLHVDVKLSDDWLEAHTLGPMMNNLVGHLAVTGRKPLDICAVKTGGDDPVYSIVVKTSEPAQIAA